MAILGTRGVPAAYGGFETLAEELGSRLVDRGHAVTVYGRSHVVDRRLRRYRGIRLRVLPTIRHKYLDTVVHTALSAVDSVPRRFDAVLVCNVANAPFALLIRLAGVPVALNVDGLEWDRRKWSLVGRAWYLGCRWLALRSPISLISDARVVARYYAEQHGRASRFIPYGTDQRLLGPGETLERLGLPARGYVLYVSRLEPENNALVVLQAYRESGIDWPLVLVGDAPYASTYRQELTREAATAPGVMMPGFVFGDGYVELQSNAGMYVQATEVGGTHPALVEAMGRGACIAANDVPEHREVLGDAGRYYPRNDVSALAALMRELAADEPQRAALRAAATARSRDRFSWDAVTDRYEALFQELADGRVRTAA